VSLIVSGLISCLFGTIADCWKFDYLLIIVSTFDVITFFMEAKTTSFITLAIAIEWSILWMDGKNGTCF